MSNYAVLVDPISSGKYLAEEFIARDFRCIAVLSKPVPDEFKCGYAPDKFEQVIMFDGDIDALAQQLARWEPACVVLGFETGLDLADRLAARLGLPGNDAATSAARRDKYEMHARLRAAGVRSVLQARVSGVEAARQWLGAHDAWPVVVKPSDSAGSDHVYICQDAQQALHAVTEVIGRTNMLGGVNRDVVLQEFLDGREWVVDTVSCDGRHVVTNVSRYLKSVLPDGSLVYRHAEFLSPSDPEHAELINYALSVNDALDVRYGAAHLEIIITDKGPTLVEINARMHGCDAVKALQWCYPVTQVDLTVDAFIAPASFERKSRLAFKNEKYMLAHYVVAEKAGTVTKIVDPEVLRSLPSYKFHCLPSQGKVVRKTISLMTSLGHVWLVNDNAAALWADDRTLTSMTQQGELLAIEAA